MKGKGEKTQKGLPETFRVWQGSLNYSITTRNWSAKYHTEATKVDCKEKEELNNCWVTIDSGKC